MGLLTNIAAITGTVMAGVAVNVLSSEVTAWAPSWARWMVARAARHMPEAERIAAEAEWLAHVEQVPGNVAKMYHAFGLWRGAVISRMTMDLFFRTFDRYAVPILIVISITSMIFDYARGVPWALLRFDVGPAVASVLMTAFYVVRAIRHRRAQKRAAAEAIAAPVKR